MSAGICHIMKNKYQYDIDIDNLDEYIDHSDKYKKYDKAEGWLLFIGAILFMAGESYEQNNLSYSVNPLNQNSSLNLSFKF